MTGQERARWLNIATGLCSPTTGQVKIEGRVAALLIWINAALLSLNRAEVRARFDEIVYFSGIGKGIKVIGGLTDSSEATPE
jgi:ABC-type polysaccharide/polyol phosphate transport system ATPase subunit